MGLFVVSFWRLCMAIGLFSILFITIGADIQQQDGPPVYEADGQKVLRKLQPTTSTPSRIPSQAPPPTGLTLAPDHELFDLHDTLYTMQDQYFSLWLGKWTTAIDWTAAVLSTHLTATLSTISKAFTYTGLSTSDVENEINKYFAHSMASYYGEEAFAIRLQAYDDMLWVVLEWLESIKFIQTHSSNHRTSDAKDDSYWHGMQFTPAFAHRARVFYELAEEGWDSRLCGGGMTWNPRLLPYKNAITNQLYITASINMYLHFPGDQNDSPFSPSVNITACMNQLHGEKRGNCDDGSMGMYDPRFLKKAVDGYNWLRNSGMINEDRLYTDGFHIRDYAKNRSATTCDVRNEMVYTYNQGVILSGLRGLWEATGNITYIRHGHQLVTSVAGATGWIGRGKGGHEEYDSGTGNKWHGLGANGILMDFCDPSGSCNQDGQTFKGIFFHHLASFCEPLPLEPVESGVTFGATEEWAFRHRRSCNEIAIWVRHNAQAALSTRDAEGRFGSWWGAPHISHKTILFRKNPDLILPTHAIDYRNLPSLLFLVGIDPENSQKKPTYNAFPDFKVYRDRKYRQAKPARSGDLNDRGRGRTVESQGSGLAVVRAMHEFKKRSEQKT
ncbi:Six-hairpin glycosidase [Ophiobolus disseminans]|uniref:Six-hairpin glycosidase n=1 Tax=Ophiobolus disseminans TaxID=1469910 RepID=A0A6A6ZPZ9_9PLEO|nr:Six-hairpin glycosidase [Ophiobolus disseminans]